MFNNTPSKNLPDHLILASSLAVLGFTACVDETFEGSLDEREAASPAEWVEPTATLVSIADEAQAGSQAEFTTWPGPRLSSADNPPLSDEEYDVIALSDTISVETLGRVHEAATQYEAAVFYSVQEERHVQYVVAVPSEEEHVFIEDMVGLLSGPTVARNTVCNRLYRYPFWVGSQFMICGSYGSGSHGYANLSTYGFDNAGSSYYVDSLSNFLDLYDGYQFSNHLVGLDWDVLAFPSSYNNKASSIWGAY